MSTKPELHVVFGSGPVGMAIIDELLARGKRVWLVKRSGRADVPPGVEVVKGDAVDVASTREVCRDATHVYNATNAPDYHKWPEQFPPLQAGVLEGATANNAKLIVMENLYMYGPNGGQPMTEESPLNGRGGRGGTRKQMTIDLFEAHKRGKVQVLSGRASDFFGPRASEEAFGQRFILQLLSGKAAQALGNPDLLHSFTYVHDVGKALVTLAESDDAYGQAWHLPSQVISAREFVTQAAAIIGIEPKLSALSKSPMRAVIMPMIGLFVPAMRGFGEMFYQFDEPFIVDTSKIEQRFSLKATPLHEALTTSIQWAQQQAAGH